MSAEASLRRGWLIFWACAAAYFLSYFYRSANAIIAPDLAAEMALEPAQLGFMTSLFFLTFAAVQLPLGPALDRWGARLVTPGIMLAAAAGSALFAVAGSFEVLTLGRALMGVGMAAVLMGSLKALAGWFPAERFGTVSGLLLGLGSLGALAATSPLAAINDAVGWRYVFWSGAVVILVAAAVFALVTKRGPLESTAAQEAGGESLWLVYRSATFWRIALLGFALTGSMFAYQGLWAGPYLIDRMGLSTITAGNLLLLMGAGVSAGYLVVGWLGDRLGLARVIGAGASGLLLVQLSLAFLPAAAGGWILAALFLLFGLGGSFSVLFFAHARAAFPANMTGRAITGVNLLGIGGSAVLQALLGVIIGAFPETTAGSAPPMAYTAAFLFTASLLAVALALYVPLIRSSSPGDSVGTSAQ